MEQSQLFAHVNDSIRDLASEDPAAQTWEFICECSDLSCHELVTLTLSEFDEHRLASPALPILATEHVDRVDRSRSNGGGA
jgi:hypothetical protein